MRRMIDWAADAPVSSNCLQAINDHHAGSAITCAASLISWHGNIFLITDRICNESAGDQCIPLKKGSVIRGYGVYFVVIGTSCWTKVVVAVISDAMARRCMTQTVVERSITVVGQGTLHWRHRSIHGDVITWKHFPRYWSFVWGINRWSPFTKASDAELWYFPWSAPE